MNNIRISDNDGGEITATLDGKEIRGWFYKTRGEQREKMQMAHEFAEGWFQATISLIKETKMKPWTMKQDPEDGSWDVEYESDDKTVLLAYGLTREKAMMIAAAPAMTDALTQLISWVEECGSDHEGRDFALMEARAALHKFHVVSA